MSLKRTIKMYNEIESSGPHRRKASSILENVGKMRKFDLEQRRYEQRKMVN